MPSRIASDVLRLVTGFGSVRVVHSTGETRGLLDDDDTIVQLPDGSTGKWRGRQLLIAAAALPDLVAEDTLDIGTLADDDDLATYRVSDVRRQADGTVWEVQVMA